MKNASNLNVMFFHGKTIDGYRFTISGAFEKKGISNNILSLGIAVCGDNDLFNKVKGRGISTGRLLNQRNSELGGRIEKVFSQFSQQDFATFTEDVSRYNDFTKKELLKEFGLRKPIVLSEYEEKRIEILKEFAKRLRELNDEYRQ